MCESMLCSDPNCDIHSHVCEIDEFYDCIVNALTVASDCLVTDSHGNYKHVPGWNDHVKDLHSVTRDAYLLWRYHGKFRAGAVFENMYKTRAQFKYALKMCQREEQKMRPDAMASKLVDMRYDEFWKDVSKKKLENHP
jgi:hypothetical protein